MRFRAALVPLAIPTLMVGLIGVAGESCGWPRADAQTAQPTRATTAADDPTLFPIDQAWSELTADQRRAVDQVVLTAYADIISPLGSSDLVIIRDRVRDSFIDHCREQIARLAEMAAGPTIDDALFCWRLLSLRKAGRLPNSQGRPRVSRLTDQERMIAEIVSRRAEDQFHQSLDRILVDRHGRQYWDSAARQLTATLDLDNLRRAALSLRKTRHLRPELAARLIDWPIEHQSFAYLDLVADSARIPTRPGIYLFRDPTGYLYIGEAQDLRQRLSTHLQASDRETLATYLQQAAADQIFVDLHVFPADSPGRTLSVRRAYESELIRSRQPKFNLRP